MCRMLASLETGAAALKDKIKIVLRAADPSAVLILRTHPSNGADCGLYARVARAQRRQRDLVEAREFTGKKR